MSSFLEQVFQNKNIESVTYKQWFNNPKPTLEKVTKSVDDFIPYFCEKMLELLPHSFIAYEQSKYSRQLKNDLKEGEFLIIVDFAENYAFTVQNAIPGFHWNNDQATIYNIVVYYKDGELTSHRSLVIISEVLHHDSIAVYGMHKIMIDYLKSTFDVIKKIFYFSDGARQQYKNFKNVINVAYHKSDFSIDAEWHFFATAHGKGPCDGLGATVKRGAIRASLQSGDQNHILSAHDLFEWLSSTGRMPSITFRYFSKQEYDSSGRFLKKRFEIKSRISNLHKQHCLIPLGEGVVRVKTFSLSENYDD